MSLAKHGISVKMCDPDVVLFLGKRRYGNYLFKRKLQQVRRKKMMLYRSKAYT